MVRDDVQEDMDAFYWSHGPCCAGCDWWQEVRAGRVGLCTKSAPVASEQRAHMIGIERHSLHLGAGHVFTQRAHHCGDFKDDFDWSRLPLAYRVRIGAPMHKEPTP